MVNRLTFKLSIALTSFIAIFFLTTKIDLENGYTQATSAYPAANPTSTATDDPYPASETNPTPPTPVPPTNNSPITNEPEEYDILIYPEIIEDFVSTLDSPPPPTTTRTETQDVPVGWSTLFFDDSPLKNREYPCDESYDFPFDNVTRYWESEYFDDFYEDAAWPASGGNFDIDPHGNYPPNFSTWMYCGGTFDFTDIQAFRIDFSAPLIDLADENDFLQVAVFDPRANGKAAVWSIMGKRQFGVLSLISMELICT